jgi:hypothetical protein
VFLPKFYIPNKYFLALQTFHCNYVIILEHQYPLSLINTFLGNHCVKQNCGKWVNFNMIYHNVSYGQFGNSCGIGSLNHALITFIPPNHSQFLKGNKFCLLPPVALVSLVLCLLMIISYMSQIVKKKNCHLKHCSTCRCRYCAQLIVPMSTISSVKHTHLSSFHVPCHRIHLCIMTPVFLMKSCYSKTEWSDITDNEILLPVFVSNILRNEIL